MKNLGPVFIQAVHRYAFRPDQAAKITGVFLCQPSGDKEPRPCFQVQYPDGFEDVIPIAEIMNGYYKLVDKESPLYPFRD